MDLPRRLLAEFLGTGLLVSIVVGSGIMATSLSNDVGLQLLLNAGATVAGLGVLIAVLGPVSGAHFNPLVTGVALVRREVRAREAAAYVVVQLVGAVVGVMLANVMFSLPAVEASTDYRGGTGVWIGEIVATAGLLLAIGALTRSGRGAWGAVVVPAWIGAAYLFTSSTSFANPAVTIGRAFTDSFAGIAPASVPAFIGFQVVGAAVGAVLTELLYPRRGARPEPLDLPAPIHAAG
ncbi:MAG: aquaporin family protein [Actinomycetota bacterium]|nr:MAG: aquaporin family protein [Actinomycetota bacterium]